MCGFVYGRDGGRCETCGSKEAPDGGGVGQECGELLRMAGAGSIKIPIFPIMMGNIGIVVEMNPIAAVCRIAARGFVSMDNDFFLVDDVNT